MHTSQLTLVFSGRRVSPNFPDNFYHANNSPFTSPNFVLYQAVAQEDFPLTSLAKTAVPPGLESHLMLRVADIVCYSNKTSSPAWT